MPQFPVIGLCILLLTGCGIPPVDTRTISNTPASARSFAIAESAVRACAQMPDQDRVRGAFHRVGFTVSRRTEVSGNDSYQRTVIAPPIPEISVLFAGNSCWVGLQSMTPEQSTQLAQIWVRAYGARPNSDFGDGLSDHVSGAWRLFFRDPPQFPDRAAYDNRIFIAAYKTWPSGPYDPQRQVGYDVSDLFPRNQPGAAVRLTYVQVCDPIIETGPRRGVFLPC